jgi:hypothetical protein
MSIEFFVLNLGVVTLSSKVFILNFQPDPPKQDMPIYHIPPQVISGFKEISSLNESQIKSVTSNLAVMKLGEGIRQAIEKSTQDLGLTSEQLDSISASLFSMVDIFFDSKDTGEIFSENFTRSYAAVAGGIPEKELDSFKRNITSLVASFGSNMRATLKAQDLIRENPNNFFESRIISDIRIVYDDDTALEKKEQFALVVHHLRIKYFSKATPRGEIFISLDIKDLHDLQKVINRAIEKDSLMRANNHELIFVNP